MTALAEKLKTKGVDTVGAQFTVACTNALREHPDDLRDAWRKVGATFGHDFLLGLMEDMGLPHRTVPHVSQVSEARAPSRPNIITAERVERRRKLSITLREVIRSKFKTSDGRSWSDVGWHELLSMARDGNAASVLLKAGPANIPNDGRKVPEVLGAKRMDELLATVLS